MIYLLDETCLFKTEQLSKVCLKRLFCGPIAQFVSHCRYQSLIGRKSRFLPQLGGPGRNIAVTFGVEKLNWGSTRWWKTFENVSTQWTNVTDRETPDDGIGRACRLQLRGNNQRKWIHSCIPGGALTVLTGAPYRLHTLISCQMTNRYVLFVSTRSLSSTSLLNVLILLLFVASISMFLQRKTCSKMLTN